MVITIYSSDSPLQVGKKLKKLFKDREKNSFKKKFDANKFAGVLKLNEDPVKLQRKWRSEWER